MTKRIVFALFWTALLWGLLDAQDLHSRNYTPDEQLILVGTGALNDGFYEIAERQFSQFVKDYPTHEKRYEVFYLLGKTLFLQKKLRESKTWFLKLLNENKRFEYTDQTLYWLADIEIRLGNGEEARKVLSSIVGRFPNFEWIDYAYYLLGLLDFGSGRLSQAEASFKKVQIASKHQPLTQTALLWLGLLSFKQKNYEGTIRYLKPLWEDPKLLPEGYLRYVLFWLGEAHLKLERFSEATLNFRTFRDRFKTDPLLREVDWRIGFCEYRSGNFKEAIQILQALKAQFKDSPLLFNIHYLLGKMFLLNRDPSASIREINSIVYSFPGHPLTGASFLTLFWSYIELGEIEGADKVSQRLQKLNHAEEEKNFIQWLNAELIFYEGKISDALPYYFNILNSRFREKALYKIGRGYFFENKFREAITNLDILLLEFPGSQYASEGLFMKAECLNRLGNLDGALDAYQLLVSQNRNDLWELLALTEIGNVHRVRNEVYRAQNAFKRVMDRFPDHPLYYHAALQLGNLSLRANNVRDAVHYFSLVLRGNILELFGAAYFSLGEIFYQEGNYDKAFNNFEAAIRYLGETSSWFFLSQLEIGNLHRKRGRLEEAKKAYTIILDHSKDEEMRQAAKILIDQMGSR